MKKIKKALLIAFILRFIFSFVVWHPDVESNADWGIRFWQYGPKEFYKANVWSFTWPNQPPGTIYIYAGIEKLYELIHAIVWYININVPLFPSRLVFFVESNFYPALLKLPSILADLGIAYLIYKFFKEKKMENAGIWGAYIFLFNPVIWYNSTIWGQTDSLINFITLLSFYLLTKNKPIKASILFAISIFIKASLLIFIPVFLIFFIKQRFSIQKYLLSVFLPILVIIILTLPFADKNPFTWLFYLYKDKVLTNQLQVITANAFNLWSFLTGIDLQSHYQKLLFLTYQQWGSFLFILSYIPVIYRLCKRKDNNSLFYSLAIVSFSSFMLMTNMHERYLYPLFPYFTFLLVENRKLLTSYIAVSSISFLNLYNLWFTPRLEPLIKLFDFKDHLFLRFLSLIMFVFYIYIYRDYLRLFKASRI